MIHCNDKNLICCQVAIAEKFASFFIAHTFRGRDRFASPVSCKVRQLMHWHYIRIAIKALLLSLLEPKKVFLLSPAKSTCKADWFATCKFTEWLKQMDIGNREYCLLGNEIYNIPIIRLQLWSVKRLYSVVVFFVLDSTGGLWRVQVLIDLKQFEEKAMQTSQTPLMRFSSCHFSRIKKKRQLIRFRVKKQPVKPEVNAGPALQVVIRKFEQELIG